MHDSIASIFKAIKFPLDILPFSYDGAFTREMISDQIIDEGDARFGVAGRKENYAGYFVDRHTNDHGREQTTKVAF